MIKQGDRFTNKDLQQSMQELCGYDVRKYIDNNKSNVTVFICDYGISPSQCTPDEYAALCIRAYQDIPSSAINLDKQLRDKGFKTTYRFSYNYRTGGLSPQQIIHDAYCLDWFNQIYNTAIPRTKYTKEYFNIINNAFHLSYYYAQYLWTGNPQVCRDIAQQMCMPAPEQWSQIIGAILGVGFQFHPYDVYEYSIEHINPAQTKKQFNARYAEQLAFKKQMQNNYGINTGCLVLSPQNRDKLNKIVNHTDLPYYLQVIRNLISWHNR
ncbi:MAG: hypothetical protein NC311_01300 [Muribaculaceae bacterium]|nr:hypothetical protein [Muribaculaceae bacterium]